MPYSPAYSRIKPATSTKATPVISPTQKKISTVADEHAHRRQNHRCYNCVVQATRLPLSCAINTDVDSTAIPSLIMCYKQLMRIKKIWFMFVSWFIMSTKEAASGLGFGKLRGRVSSMLPKERASELSDFRNVTNH